MNFEQLFPEAPSLHMGKFKLPEGVDHVIIDVGAYRQSEFFDMLKHDPTLFVLAFEPSPETFRVHRIAASHPRFALLNAAIAPNFGNMTFFQEPSGNFRKEWASL